jgi:hypothetical protein
MARVFDDGSNQYMDVSSTPVTAVPISISCWWNSDDDNLWQCAVCIAQNGSNDYHSLWLSDTLQVYAISRDTGNNVGALSTAVGTINTWHHGLAVFSSAALRVAYLDGGNKGEQTTSVTPAGLDEVAIARYRSPGQYYSGALAEVGVWDVALSDDDALALYQGVPAWEIKPEHLVGLWLPFGDRTDRDYSGRGYHMAATNGPTWTADPPQVVRAWRHNPQYIGRRIVGREQPGGVRARPWGKAPAAVGGNPWYAYAQQQ